MTDFIQLFDPKNKINGNKGKVISECDLLLDNVSSERSSIFFFGMITFLDVVGRSFNEGLNRILRGGSKNSIDVDVSGNGSKRMRYGQLSKNINSQLQSEILSGFFSFIASPIYTHLELLVFTQEASIIKKYGSLLKAQDNDIENLKIMKMMILTFKLLKYLNLVDINGCVNPQTIEEQTEQQCLTDFIKDCFENDTEKEKYVSEELFIRPLMKNLMRFYFSSQIISQLKPILNELELYNSIEYIEEFDLKNRLIGRDNGLKNAKNQNNGKKTKNWIVNDHPKKDKEIDLLGSIVEILEDENQDKKLKVEKTQIKPQCIIKSSKNIEQDFNNYITDLGIDFDDSDEVIEIKKTANDPKNKFEIN
jgi:hypothetical protein